MAVSFSCKKGVEDSPFFFLRLLFLHIQCGSGGDGVGFLSCQGVVKKVRKFSFLFLFVTAAADEFRSERRDDDDEMSNGGGRRVGPVHLQARTQLD